VKGLIPAGVLWHTRISALAHPSDRLCLAAAGLSSPPPPPPPVPVMRPLSARAGPRSTSFRRRRAGSCWPQPPPPPPTLQVAPPPSLPLSSFLSFLSTADVNGRHSADEGSRAERAGRAASSSARSSKRPCGAAAAHPHGAAMFGHRLPVVGFKCCLCLSPERKRACVSCLSFLSLSLPLLAVDDQPARGGGPLGSRAESILAAADAKAIASGTFSTDGKVEEWDANVEFPPEPEPAAAAAH
jgi:hypothetical protein